MPTLEFLQLFHANERSSVKSAHFPENEELRLKGLQELNILDTEPEKAYDEITELAALICETPLSLITFVDRRRTWIKSAVGSGCHSTPREESYCPHAILTDGLFEVPDSRQDDRFFDNPNVLSEPPVIFYAGFPLEISDDIRVGTLCVVDHVPRKLSDRQRQALRCLANQARDQLRLRRANTELAKAFQARSLFFSSMTHEIRTPLNGILGITDLLKDSIGGKDREKLESIQNCGKTLLRVVNDILDFAKMESGRMDLENAPFDLHDLVSRNIRLLEPLAGAKGLQLETRSHVAPARFQGDATRIGQILFNLVGNAIKFSDRGTVSLEVDSGSPGRLRFTIRDQGKGIPESMRDKLFKRFSQVDGFADSKLGGTGLGLVISKGLAEAMDGGITFESQVGKGTAFFVEIRCPCVEPDPEATFGPKQDWKAAGASVSQTVRILIAEDDPVNQMVALGFLGKLGIQADLAQDGEEAVGMALKSDYDLILMDCKMPVMDGFEAAGRILADAGGAGRTRPVILALTASATQEVRDRCRSEGMQDVLLKPISFEALEEAVSRWWPSIRTAGTGP